MDLKLSGSGVVPAGEYGSVMLRGKVRFLGDIQCNAFSSSGSLKGEGLVCAGKVAISGASKWTKAVSATDLRVSGSFACDAVTCQNLSIKGAVTTAGDMVADENAELKGRVICGILSAKRISVVFDAKTEIYAIKGGTVSVKKKILPFIQNARVTTSVEADDVSLSRVSCPSVVGKRVTIGKGCEIALVQYSETVEISGTAKVGKIEKIL